VTALLRVVVTDDDAEVRNDLRRLLELEPDIEVVAVANDGRHAVEVCAFHEPDVVVMDVRMPVLDGIAATLAIRSAAKACGGSGPAVLILTTFDLDEYVLGAVRAGAAGFLLKDQAPELLAAAVRTVSRGEAILAPRATARLIEEFTEPRRHDSPVHGLTRREVDVLRLIAQGLSNDEIAAALVVSVATVKTHVSNLLTKLQVDNRLQAVIWAYEHDVVGKTS
jgi:DNA-binding NarL/FixJ family response regulator